MQRREEPAGFGAGIDEHVNVQVGRQTEPPVALAVADGAGQAFVEVAILQIAGIEVAALVGGDAERHGLAAGVARVVVGGDAYGAGFR